MKAANPYFLEAARIEGLRKEAMALARPIVTAVQYQCDRAPPVEGHCAQCDRKLADHARKALECDGRGVFAGMDFANIELGLLGKVLADTGSAVAGMAGAARAAVDQIERAAAKRAFFTRVYGGRVGAKAGTPVPCSVCDRVHAEFHMDGQAVGRHRSGSALFDARMDAFLTREKTR